MAMFNKNSKKNDSSSETESKSSSGESTPSVIGKGNSIEGVFNCTSDVRIDGQLKGYLKSTGKIIVGPEGVIEGEIICEKALIQGSITGTLSVKDMLEVKETAKITGKIFAGKLQVQSGAEFNVTCDMSGKQLKSFTRKEDEAGEVVSLVK